MNSKNEKAQGCACEADLEKKVNELVDEVKGYSKSERDEKKKEVEAAFKADKPKK